MKRSALLVLVTVGLLTTSIAAVAQSAVPAGQSATLSRETSAVYSLSAQAQSADRDTVLAAFTRVQAIISKGGLGPKETTAIVAVLSDLAGAGTTHPIVTGNAVINNFPYIRMRACQLLGEVGGNQSVATLLQVLLNDPQTMVLSEATYQLGRIGKNPSDAVSSTIAWVVGREDAIRPDDNLAYSALLAFENIARANHGLTDPSVYEAISQIQVGDYVLAVKEKALQVLDQLRTYG